MVLIFDIFVVFVGEECKIVLVIWGCKLEWGFIMLLRIFILMVYVVIVFFWVDVWVYFIFDNVWLVFCFYFVKLMVINDFWFYSL